MICARMRVEEFYMLTFNAELNPQATGEEAPIIILNLTFKLVRVQGEH